MAPMPKNQRSSRECGAGGNALAKVLGEAGLAVLVLEADHRRLGQDYNMVRPHSALGYMTPEEFEHFTLTWAEPVALST